MRSNIFYFFVSFVLTIHCCMFKCSFIVLKSLICHSQKRKKKKKAESNQEGKSPVGWISTSYRALITRITVNVIWVSLHSHERRSEYALGTANPVTQLSNRQTKTMYLESFLLIDVTSCPQMLNTWDYKEVTKYWKGSGSNAVMHLICSGN
jgi:hypothetical protein